MNNGLNIPQLVAEAFPPLSSATFIRRLASPVPLVPDTTFDIFITKSGHFLTFVTTDYADPLDQSRELKRISGQHAFEFVDLLEPYGNGNETIAICEHDDIERDFLVEEDSIRYYVANTKSDLAQSR